MTAKAVNRSKGVKPVCGQNEVSVILDRDFHCEANGEIGIRLSQKLAELERLKGSPTGTRDANFASFLQQFLTLAPCSSAQGQNFKKAPP